MCNKDQLVSFLYDEMSSSERAAFEAHLSACSACREEAGDLRRLRRDLAAWAPPDGRLGLQVPRAPAAPRRAPLRVPAWGLAAAASLFLLAGAAALANVEFRYGSDGFVIRTGWAGEVAGRPAATPADAAAAQASSDATTSEDLMLQIAALERRLRELEAGRADDAPQPVSARAGLTPEQLAGVRRLIAESEARQRAERTLQVTQVWNDFNAARASDFVRMHEALGRVQGLTNYQLKQQRESIDSLYRVSMGR